MQDVADGAHAPNATLPLSWNVMKDRKRGEKGLGLAAVGTWKSAYHFEERLLLLIISARFGYWGVSFEFNHLILHTSNKTKKRKNLRFKMKTLDLPPGSKRGENRACGRA